MNNRSLSTILLLSSVTIISNASADTFVVQNQHGLPIKNAVLEFSVTDTAQDTNNTPNTLIMDQVDKLFKPDVLVIQQGDFVDFPNSDNIRHHVYSFSSVNPFEIKLYSGRPEAPLQFNNAGVAVLGCNIHDSMVGYIYIARSKNVIMTDENGLATFANNQAFTNVSVWHASALTSVKTIAYSDLVTSGDVNKSFLIELATEAPAPRNTFQSIFNKNGK